MYIETHGHCISPSIGNFQVADSALFTLRESNQKIKKEAKLRNSFWGESYAITNQLALNKFLGAEGRSVGGGDVALPPLQN